MTPPVPPDGFELVDDEPRENDMAWLYDQWEDVDGFICLTVKVLGMYEVFINARDLRWIARRK